ncbi:glycosyltransferase [Actinoplanes sp. KI2]|uniref:glycosyltransferase n=1 Tax=Actinoplanes sp. KI2 TaxID=2983315 RepID=UPI0021D606D8|nr:glycosyltransferase family 2 protein [Actinoplanes sp. KI2]MCU7726408.1 glycosyltransferase [Actinoplanes sp. KI2]
MTGTETRASVVVPAHNEAAVIGRLLTALVADARPGEFDIVVVPNGCTDDTAAIARSFGESVTVVETPVANKHHALRLGDRHAGHHPRVYVDGDVVLDAAAVRHLADALSEPGVLAAAPARRLNMTGRALVVRWYYRVWELLPSVREGLYGRGVVAIAEGGHQRIAEMPEAMGDDLAASVAFAPTERRVVEEAVVEVHPPRTTRDLIKRRVRSLTATAQMREISPEHTDQARTSRADLVRLTRGQPALLPHVAVFLAVTVIARLKARKPVREGDFSTWLRDESSRTA